MGNPAGADNPADPEADTPADPGGNTAAGPAAVAVQGTAAVAGMGSPGNDALHPVRQCLKSHIRLLSTCA